MLHASRAIENAHAGNPSTQTLPSSVLIVLGISLFSAGLLALPWLFGTISMVRYVYPVLALVIGLVLYRTFPILFVGYTWWLWFLSAFVARVVDYYVGVYQRPNLIMLAPTWSAGLPFSRCFAIVTDSWTETTFPSSSCSPALFTRMQ